MQSAVNEKHVFSLQSALAQVFPCAGIVSFTQPELYGAHFTALTTPFLRHSARIEDLIFCLSFAFLPWSWINSRPCAGNPCAGGSSLDDAGPRGGGPETLCELPRDAELLLLLDELLARFSLFAKPLTTPAASLIALSHDIHSVLLYWWKPSGGKLSSHCSHSWCEYLWNKRMVHDNVFEKCSSKMLTCTKKITGGGRGNSREGERKFRQHQHRASVF